MERVNNQRAAKEATVGEIKAEFANVMSVVMADFRGVDVETVTAIRRDCRANGLSYRVLKNTLVKVAVKDDPKLAPMVSLLKGPTALIWSTESASAPAKMALKHAKEVEKFSIKGAFFDGQVLDAKGVDQLALMPGKPELQASLLMTFMAAPTDFVRLLAAGPTNFLYVLGARERALGGK
jgi:large subunit ribosomal protein L10